VEVIHGRTQEEDPGRKIGGKKGVAQAKESTSWPNLTDEGEEGGKLKQENHGGMVRVIKER